MPKLRRLSGDDVVSIFRGFGFLVAAQHGSHLKLVQDSPPGRQVLTIPAHRELDTGALRAFIRQAGRFVAADELEPHSRS